LKILRLLGGQPGDTTTSPDGEFTYDNILYPLLNPAFDNSGVLFSIAGEEGNIFSGWGIAPADYSYYRYASDGGYDIENDSVNFTLTAVDVPEPTSLVLLGTCFAGLGAIRRRRPFRRCG
jgi:hypothetical protein